MCSARPSLAPSVWAIADESGIAERGEPDPEDARLVVGDKAGGGLEGEAGLARAAGAGHGEQASPALDPGDDLGELSLSSHEGARRPREVRVGDRLQRRELSFAELEDPDGLADVLEPVLAEVRDRETLIDELSRGFRQDDLSAVR